MGVPAFYKWLITKYPKSISSSIQDTSTDPTSPNPNGFEFDNLYFDMNGIIHPCFHPENPSESERTTFDQVFLSIFDYVDRLFNIVRPRKLVFFAIDGVAPRAKMNQQRARRYQSARNNEISEAEEDRLRSQYEREGKKLIPKPESQLQDSNIITPGTEFMRLLSKALQVYIQTRLKESPAWKNLKVILSDSNVPGEGEHKIMSFIRSQRSLPDYDVNTRHCLHGLDADLIMLALATHELHFSILREVLKEDCIPSSIQNQDRDGKEEVKAIAFPVKKICPYQFLHVWILREYLELDMRPSEVPEGFKFDTERAIDDFVFLCFFVGNDFLPHLPSLDIYERALDLLMTVYKTDFKSLGGYIVDAERVNDPQKCSYLKLKRVESLVLSIGSHEDNILKKRTELRERQMNRVLRDLRDEEACVDGDVEDEASLHSNSFIAEDDNVVENTKQLKEAVRNYMLDKSDVFKTGLFGADKIKYGTAGWKERYYQEKFATEDHDKLETIKKAVVKEYIQGLCWVLLYYFSGVPSWTWFYPYNYAPCASDLKGLGQLQVKFKEGFPFEPFDQLMAVLPPRSAGALPRSFRTLMMDEYSDIASFYPREFVVDIDGKRFLWQGQVILPFIDEKRLLASTNKAKDELKEYEEERNLLKSDLLFVRASSDSGHQILIKIDENPSNANGDGCFIITNLQELDSSEGEDKILCVNFALAKPRILVPRILENVKFPDERTVNESDIEETVLWHEQQGNFRGQRVPHQTRHLGAPPENESSGLVAGSGGKGRGRGRGGGSRQGPYNNHPNGPHSMGYPTMAGPTPPYNHPNGPHSARPNSATWRARCNNTASPVASNLCRGPSYAGNPPPMAGPTSRYNRPRAPPPQGFRPRGGGVNSSYPSRVNLEVSLQNLRVSSAAPQGGGVGRGRGSYGVDDYHRCNNTASPVSSNWYRGPCYAGNPPPMAGPTSRYNRPRAPPPQGFRPRGGGVNSSYPSRVNLEVSLQNLRVSSAAPPSAAPQGGGFGRGRGSYGQ